LPMLVLSGVTTTWSAVLNAENRFVLPALVPAVSSLITVVVLLTAGSLWGIFALVGSTVGGAVLEAALLAFGLARAGVPLTPRWHGRGAAVRQVLGQYAPMVA